MSDETFAGTEVLLQRQVKLQTDYIANENHVKSAQAAAEEAKTRAREAGDELYVLNDDFREVADTLQAKTASIGTAKDKAVDLQKRANTLANTASNKLVGHSSFLFLSDFLFSFQFPLSL